MTEVLYREVAVRAVDTEAREVVGLAVPYGETIDVGGYQERFERGDHAFAPDAVLYAVHEHRTGGLPIGRVVASEDTDEGVLVRARISETERGDEVYTLLRDGVIKGFSVGFEPMEHRIEDDVVVRTKTRFFEVSVTPHAAYKTASIAEVRSEVTEHERGAEMPEVTEADVSELRDTITDLERKIGVLQERDDAPKGPQFRTGGELLKALARGDEAAQAEFRAADTTPSATSAQAGATAYNGWVNRPLRFVQEKRRITNLFSRGPLPSHGNTVEFPKVGSVAGAAAAQSSEGAALGYIEVELSTGTASVGTYGGYSRLSRQAIERSDLAYLDAVLRYQAIQYAKATETDVRAALTGITGAGAATLAADTVQGWIDLVIDAAAEIEDDSLGLQAEFMVVSRDIFKMIAHKVDSAGRPVFVLNGDGQNTVGAANIVRPSFSIGGLQGTVDPNLAADSCYVAAAEALTVLESPGAPFRLQDESVVNLTKDFSLYGYQAVTVNDAKGVVVCDVDLVP